MGIHTFRYKNLLGSVEADLESKCLYGKLLNIGDLVTYEAETLDKLELSFKEAVDDYIQACEELDRPVQKSFKGSLNVRIGSELHRLASEHAVTSGVSLNDYIKLAVEHQIKSENHDSRG